MLRIALVARDGYLDLLPKIAEFLKKEGDVYFDFVFFCHTEKDSQYLGSNYGIKNPVVLGTEIAKIQHNISFSDEMLKSFSEKYNKIPLVRCLWSSRHEKNISEHELKHQALSTLIFWENYFKQNKIDVLVYERPSILSNCLAWLVCQEMNIACIDFVDLTINKMSFTAGWLDDYSEIVKKNVRSINWGNIDKNSPTYKEAAEYLHSMLFKPQHPVQVINVFKFTEQTAVLSFFDFFKFFKKFREITQKSKYFSRWTLREMVFERLKYCVRYRIHKIWNFFDNNLDLDKEHYFFFPLHIKGEWSNHVILGLEYSDPLGAIKKIAQCLSPWSKLYVKEHYSMFAERSLSFYRDLKKISNVRLIHPQADTFELIKKSQGVVTLGATVGFEALLFNKPVILFCGEPWYKDFPGVTKIETTNGLASAFQNVETLDVMTDQEKFEYVYALFDMSFYGFRVPSPQALSPENIKSMAMGLKSYCSGLSEKVSVENK